MEIILVVTAIALLLAATAVHRAAHTGRHRGPTVAEIQARLRAEATRTYMPVPGGW